MVPQLACAKSSAHAQACSSEFSVWDTGAPDRWYLREHWIGQDA
jgi:hypothetical protein